MKVLMLWVLPIAILAVGIAIFTGIIMPQLPRESGLRPLLGAIVVLFAVYRFVAARTPRAPQHRRFGGERTRPWEK